MLAGGPLSFSAAAGGVLCPACSNQSPHAALSPLVGREGSVKGRDGRPLSLPAWQALVAWNESGEAWRVAWDPVVRAEVRQVLGQYVTYLGGRRPRLLPYLGS